MNNTRSSFMSQDKASRDCPEDESSRGWLQKQGQRFKTWKWRYFVLEASGNLVYYTDKSRKEKKGTIDCSSKSLAQVAIQAPTEDHKHHFLIYTSHKTMMLIAHSEDEMKRWVLALKKAGIQKAPSWNPSRNALRLMVSDAESVHEWKIVDDPTRHLNIQGYLTKRGHKVKNWTQRYCVIEEGCFKYYLSESVRDMEPRGCIKLANTTISPGMVTCPNGRQNYFVLATKDGEFELHMNATTEEDMYRWINTIREAQTILSSSAREGQTAREMSKVMEMARLYKFKSFSLQVQEPSGIGLSFERATDAVMVFNVDPASHYFDDASTGGQIIAIDHVSILNLPYPTVIDQLSRDFSVLTLVRAPYRIGMLTKKSRSGFGQWRNRCIKIQADILHYYQVAQSSKKTDSSPMTLKGSFNLRGCHMSLSECRGRPFCITIVQSPEKKLVLETPSARERLEWASTIYCAIRFATEGLTRTQLSSLVVDSSPLTLK